MLIILVRVKLFLIEFHAFNFLHENVCFSQKWIFFLICKKKNNVPRFIINIQLGKVVYETL